MIIIANNNSNKQKRTPKPQASDNTQTQAETYQTDEALLLVSRLGTPLRSQLI